MSTAGATFQRLIDKVIGNLEPNCYAYLDDICIVSETFEQHLKLLREVIQRIINANLTVNREKSVFCAQEVKYLGFVINYEGLKVDPEKTRAVKEYPKPRTVKQLRRYVGMLSWYRRSIKDFAKIAEPLIRLTRKDEKFKWEKEQDEAFEKLKELLLGAPTLHRPVTDAEYFVHTDACDTGLGAMITQKIDGVERVIAFASRALHKNERNFSTTEKNV